MECRYPTTPPVTDPRASRYALCIGIDRYPSAPLYGCVNDAELWARTLANLGFEVEIITNDLCTRAGIQHSVHETIAKAKAGDCVVIHYSGHGTQLRHQGRTVEAYCPIDYATNGFMVDYQIGQWVDQLGEGGNLTIFADCCHSGESTRTMGGPTDCDLVRQIPADDAMQAVFAKQCTSRDIQDRATSPYIDKMEILFAACMKSQTAKESGGYGHFTKAATSVLQQRGDQITNAQLIDATRAAGAHVWNQQRPELWSCPDKHDDDLFSVPVPRSYLPYSESRRLLDGELLKKLASRAKNSPEFKRLALAALAGESITDALKAILIEKLSE